MANSREIGARIVTFPEVKEATDKFNEAMKAAMAAGIPTTMEEIRERSRKLESDRTRRRNQRAAAALAANNAEARELKSKPKPKTAAEKYGIPYLKSCMEAAGADGIYVDASYSQRTKIGKYAVVRRTENGVDASIRQATFKSSDYAEIAAIQLAINLYADGDIYSDSQGAVQHWHKKGVSRVYWIPRGQNQVAVYIYMSVI